MKWIESKKVSVSSERSLFNWIATVSTLLPNAVFARGQSVRDDKARIVVRLDNESLECVLPDDSPTKVVEAFAEKLGWRVKPE